MADAGNLLPHGNRVIPGSIVTVQVAFRITLYAMARTSLQELLEWNERHLEDKLAWLPSENVV
jgi:hypothetical protein